MAAHVQRLGPVIAPARDQIAMWLVVPLWCIFLCVGFLARTRLRCLVWFVGANLGAAALWWVLQ
ncbi:hypothetical protein [Diaphorobacter aerolatus]|uniref:Uncharacterized protein n=1 Tax=Diaphorobacter aerolatus TaxID=1288495 RepID=A0A7H0GHZ8_9BURK|nr:hypothetical protein [Diaphorobacter aerolatus]QNP47914.1 hypothetical protein H9K75_17585 [Diaphorobacter aerolatus]